MHTGRYVFSQIIDFLPERDFRRIANRYRGDYKRCRLSSWEHMLVLAFSQLTARESLREIEDCLRPMGSQLYHLGFRGSVARSTIADANATRDWRIFRDFALVLIKQARRLYSDQPSDIEGLDATVYAIDSTTVDLCLSLFPWASFRRTKAAVKVHTLLDLRGPLPVLVHVTDGKVHDVNWLDALAFETGCFYVLDRGYVDFARLSCIDRAGAYFVTRAKSNLGFYCCHAQPIPIDSGVVCDQIIRLTNPKSKEAYPDKLRRVVFIDPETGKRLVFLTNNFALPALTIALLYKARWQIELFFKWIKSNLRIKAFLGREPNAVYSQVWCAIAIYTLLLIIRRQLHLEAGMHTILTVLSINIFMQVPILHLFRNSLPTGESHEDPNQLVINF
jgi:IS4 transposase